jgi:type IV pilus assembly protein PilO
MRRDFKLERRAIIAGLVLLVGADLALAVYGWNASSGPRPQQDLAILTRNRDLLKADVTRALDIRSKIPAIQKDCDTFERDSLFPDSTGYSSVASELGSIANKSGLQLESTAYHQKNVKARGLTEVDIDAVVSGSYAGVVRFLNGLQRSKTVYAVEGLTAKSEAQQQQSPRGEVHVTMHIKTYFRAA